MLLTSEAAGMFWGRCFQLRGRRIVPRIAARPMIPGIAARIKGDEMTKGKATEKSNKGVKEMAYAVESCPPGVKELIPEAMAKWMEIANACIAAGDGKDFAEARAWTAVKECWAKNEAGDWCKQCPATGGMGFFSKDEIEKKGYVQVKDNTLADPTHEIKGLEIFAAGKWNGDDYTEKDLDAIVTNFEKGIIKSVPLKVGHDDKQKVAGQPAVGILTRVYRAGQKLMADVANIPKVVADLINKKAYHSVSSEIAWNADFNGSIFEKLLTGVALLGAEIPAVNILADIPAVYKAEFNKVAVFEVADGVIQEPAAEPPAPIAPAAPAAAPVEPPAAAAAAAAPAIDPPESDEVKQLKAKLALADAELVKIKADREAELAAAGKITEETEIRSFTAALVDQKKVVPALAGRIVRSLIDADNATKRDYDLGDGKPVTETARENLRRLYEGLAELRIFTEQAHAEEHAAGSDDDKAISLAKQYVSDKKSPEFKDALVKVYDEHPEWRKAAKPIK